MMPVVHHRGRGLVARGLDGEDAGGHPHPLEIARELIATGKPRSALELLSLHHDELVDDPEYLLICSEAWWAEGDALRAQQALLGAARLAADASPGMSGSPSTVYKYRVGFRFRDSRRGTD